VELLPLRERYIQFLQTAASAGVTLAETVRARLERIETYRKDRKIAAAFVRKVKARSENGTDPVLERLYDEKFSQLHP
jgi:hypothetical protein